MEVGSAGPLRGRAGTVRAGTVLGMNTSWWLVFAAVVLLALVATVVDGWGRGRRPRGRGRRPPDGRDGAGGRGPES